MIYNHGKTGNESISSNLHQRSLEARQDSPLKIPNIQAHHFAAALSACIFTLMTTFAVAAGSGAGSVADHSTDGQDPVEMSAKALKTGIKHRDRGLKLEAKAAAASTEKARTNLQEKALKAFGKAVTKQGEALKLDPQNYRAANELGYALRKTGDFRKAIGAYNYALDINPDFHQATEYRAEAYLALGMYDKTQRAYMTLFREEPRLADQLMSSIDTWHKANGDNLSEDAQAFAQWVEERKRLAKITSDLSSNNTRTW
jgi:tetratricopeptide (TPR) repeat protein